MAKKRGGSMRNGNECDDGRRLAFADLAARGFRILAVLILLMPVSFPASAEYADVVINKLAEKRGMRPVIFPHWFHRIRFRCKVCHNGREDGYGFIMRAGSNEIDMAKIVDGKYCGLCHNGEIAWGVENCDICHSGLPGLQPGIQRGHQNKGPS